MPVVLTLIQLNHIQSVVNCVERVSYDRVVNDEARLRTCHPIASYLRRVSVAARPLIIDQSGDRFVLTFSHSRRCFPRVSGFRPQC